MATFTANHIPKLWGEYIKRGTPAMKYNAFAVMATMIMLGFASQHLKDMLKYGLDDEDDKTGHNPYLDQAEYIRRGVFASGLFGTGERIISTAWPIYESNASNPGEWAWSEAVGQSPALSTLARGGKAVGNLVQGDLGNAARNTLKVTPVVGPINQLSDLVRDTVNEDLNWNYKGR